MVSWPVCWAGQARRWGFPLLKDFIKNATKKPQKICKPLIRLTSGFLIFLKIISFFPPPAPHFPRLPVLTFQTGPLDRPSSLQQSFPLDERAWLGTTWGGNDRTAPSEPASHPCCPPPPLPPQQLKGLVTRKCWHCWPSIGITF